MLRGLGGLRACLQLLLCVGRAGMPDVSTYYTAGVRHYTVCLPSSSRRVGRIMRAFHRLGLSHVIGCISATVILSMR